MFIQNDVNGYRFNENRQKLNDDKKLFFILSFKIEIILGGPRCWLSAVYQSEEKTRLLFHS